MPHYRRPHPALVWTGHGRAVPRIVLRKGKQPADAKPKVQPPYAVVVLNDDEHSFQYVIDTFMKVFG